MASHLICKKKGGAKLYNSLCCFFQIICLLSSVAAAAGAKEKNDPLEIFNIGAIIDVDSRVGKEQQIAMEVAVQSFNNMTTNPRLALHFRNISSNPIQAVSAAEELIREKQVKVIIGLQTWEQSVLVADVGKTSQVPVLSLASSSIRPAFAQQRWPFLIPIVPNSSDQITCIAEVIGSFNWRKVVVIYEDNIFGGGDSELIALLSEALRSVDAEIECHLVLPPVSSSMSDSEGQVLDGVANLLRAQSRVFVVLRSSIPTASLLFKEAKKGGLMGRDSVWIIADSLADLLDSIDPSSISSMQGVLGIKTYYSENSTLFESFKPEFSRTLRLEFPDEHNLEPGIHALQAYDALTAVSKAVKELGNQHNGNTSMSMLRMIRSSNFSGLTGEVRFQREALSSKYVFRIVNVVGKSYKELGFWSSSFGFAENVRAIHGAQSMEELTSRVNWPGDLNRTPKGWAMPTDEKPMIIGVPGNTTFDQFVKLNWAKEPMDYDGFCIALFKEVRKILEEEYPLPYDFVPHNGSYDDLIDNVINKNFNAIVGDITILANRSKYVDFTHPYMDSGLSMMVQAKKEPQRGWMFMKPFSMTLWAATFSIIFYTMFIVWFMEHQSNPEFRGAWKDQLGTALWFTFSSLFFAHREKIKSNYTKAVLVIWFFLVFVLAQSYNSSLTSMLTVRLLEPSVTNIEWIRKTNSSVGCDGDSFVKNYLQNVLDLKNIKTIGSPDAYLEAFDSDNIKAAFIELPYQKVFLTEYCDYTVVGPTYRFGGLGFVFEKGSPIARDVSEAILRLMEEGTIESLQNKWFGSSGNCSDSGDSSKTGSLQFESFWGLFLISGSTTTICFITFVARLTKKTTMMQDDDVGAQGNRAIQGMSDLVIELPPQQLRSGNSRTMSRFPTVVQRWKSNSSSRWELVSPTDPSEQFEAPLNPPGNLKSV